MPSLKHNIPRSLEEWEKTSSVYLKELNNGLSPYDDKELREKILLEADVIEHLIKKELKDLLRLKDEISLKRKYGDSIRDSNYELLHSYSSTIHRDMQLFQGLIKSVENKSILNQLHDEWDTLDNPHLLEISRPDYDNGRYWIFQEMAEDFYIFGIPEDLKKKIQDLLCRNL